MRSAFYGAQAPPANTRGIAAEGNHDETRARSPNRRTATGGAVGHVSHPSRSFRTDSAARSYRPRRAAMESMAKKMLIDATHPEETRVVVADGSKVDEFDFESINKRQLAGNIYLAKVTRVEPSLQAAFVEYGGNRHGFLAFSEIHPDYYQIPVADREALIAEAAAAGDPSDDDDEPKEKKKRPRRNSRGRGRKKKAADDATVEGAEGDAAVAEDEAPAAETEGAEADAAPVEVPATTGDAPAGEPVDVAKAPAEEAAETPQAEEAPTEEVPVEVAAEEPAPETEVAAETSDDETSADDDDPKTIAESAGAEDGESVSESVEDEGAPSKTPEAAEDAPVETTTEEAPAEDPVPSEAPADEPAAEVAEPAAKESKDAPAEDTSDAEAPEAAAKSDGKDADADDADDDAPSPKDEVESVGAEDVQDEVRPRRINYRRYKIQEVIKVRQILLVQVVKEERGNKGAALTTYLSLAGRYCVLMPNTARGGGISRKITNAADRKKLKSTANELEVPQGMGLIIRTAGAKRTKTEIKRDYEFLLRQWNQIRDLTLSSVAPALIYEEGDLIKRSIRDLYGRDIDTVLVEGDDAYREAKDYMKMLMPSHAKNVQQYREPTPLFSKFGVETYLSAMFNPTVQLKSGGYIVIGVTEALVAIDVNSGRSTRESSIEETALKTNLEASDEVARQLRLRDLAGLIVIDYIDMEENRNNRAVEKRLKDRLKSDRARIQVGRISGFGLMEMSRQRLRPGMLEATTSACSHCQGTGIVRSPDNVALSILREVEEEAVRRRSREIKIVAPVAIANYLMNQKRAHIAGIESSYGIAVLVEADATLTSPDYKIEKVKGQVRPPQRRTETPRAITAENSFEDAEIVADEPEQAVEAKASEQTNDAARDDEGNGEGAGQKKRRRGKRGGRRRRKGEAVPALDGEGDAPASDIQSDAFGDVIDHSEGESDSNVVEEAAEPAQKPKRKRPARRKKPIDEEATPEIVEAAAEEAFASEAVSESAAEVSPAPVEEPAPVQETATKPDAPAEAEPAPAPEPVNPPEPEVVEAAPEPEVVEPAAEPVAAEPEPEPAPPAKPRKKRIGWWS